jgi:RND family efflux transporter MFP subunit
LHHKPILWLRPAGLGACVVLALVVLAGLVARGLAGQSLKTWTAAQAVPTVGVVRPGADLGAHGLVLPGQVQAFFDAPIHARVSGYLKAWYDDIGAHVKAGQVLAIVDTPDLDQQLTQAKADLATAVATQQLAKTTAARWNGLLAQDAVSRQETEEKNGDLAEKNALVGAAQASVDRLGALESFKRITAPFDGVVTARTTDIGQLIAAGTPNDPGLFTVSDVHRLRIYVSVPQAYAARIHTGDTISLTVPEYAGRTFQASVVSTSGAIGTQTGALLVEAQIDNADGALKPGDYAQVTFNLPPETGTLSLPASALMFRHSGMEVAVVGAGDRVEMRHVTIARDLGVSVDISTGLKPGEAVIDNPPDSLVNGETVRMAGATP